MSEPVKIIIFHQESLKWRHENKSKKEEWEEKWKRKPPKRDRFLLRHTWHFRLSLLHHYKWYFGLFWLKLLRFHNYLTWKKNQVTVSCSDRNNLNVEKFCFIKIRYIALWLVLNKVVLLWYYTGEIGRILSIFMSKTFSFHRFLNPLKISFFQGEKILKINI